MKQLLIIACLSFGLSAFAEETTTTAAPAAPAGHDHAQMMKEHGGMGMMNKDEKMMKRHEKMMAKCSEKMGEAKCKEMAEMCKGNEHPGKCMHGAMKEAKKAEKK